MLKRHAKPKPVGVKGFASVYFRELRRVFVTGMLVWVPLIITLWVCWFVLSKVGLVLEVIIEKMALTLHNIGDRVGFYFPDHVNNGFAIGFAIALVLFLSTGLLTRYLVIKRLIVLGERLLQHIPLISRVYRAVQQIRDVFVSREGTVFQRVCLVEYPRAGCHVVAFVTSEHQGIVQETIGEELTAVFIPTTPNPTSGFLLYIPAKDVKPLDISVEDAMKLVISGGAFIPGIGVSGAGLLPSTPDDKEEYNLVK